MTDRIRLRHASSNDGPFLFRVYAEGRTEELAPTGWSDADKESFLRSQYEAQWRAYHERFPGAGYQVIEADGTPVGRLFVARGPGAVRVVDLALLPEYRNRGIGGGLLGSILAEAGAAGQPVRIHVERFNPARRLYERLGFVAVGQTGLYDELEWRPTGDD